MVLTLASTVVIECPHCGTRYQLPAEAIGARGRQVACAHCGQAWQAKAAVPAEQGDDGDRMFDAAAEQALDAAFEAEEAASRPEPEPVPAPSARSIAEITAAIAPKHKPSEPAPDPAGDRNRAQAFIQRQAAMARQSPLGKVRRSVRVVAVTALLLLVGLGISFRTEIVRQFPDLAGAYAAVGLGVNVVGLEFRDVTTLVTLRGGTRFMKVDARIYSVAARGVPVPPVVVTLLDAANAPLYQWSVAPAARSLEPGEVIDFTAQLNAPPLDATSVRLSFIDGEAPAVGPVPAPQATGH